MPREIPALVGFNRGIVSQLAMARTDIKRIAMSAETMTNWVPRVLGPMSLRPGLQYLGATQSNSTARILPFVFSTDDTALLEFTNSVMRVWVSDALISRPSVSTAVTNGTITQYTTTFTVTIASPAVFTYVGADNFTLNDPITFTTTGALPTGLSVGTTYYVKNVNTGANTFEVAATMGGTSINTTGSQSGVHTVYQYWYVAGWVDADEVGGTSQFFAGGYLGFIGDGSNYAIRRQEVTVAAPDRNVEHALRIGVERGPLIVRVGSSSGADDYVTETELGKGVHSLAFTPTNNFWVEFKSALKRWVLLDSCTVEPAGAFQIPTPYSATHLDKLRRDQSADVVYIACDGVQQRKIERRGTRSWSVVVYEPEDGPFRVENVGAITLTPSALSGSITLTASESLFRQTHVGSIWRVTSSGQRVSSSIIAENIFTNDIRITGTGSQRVFTIIRAGTWSATVTLQRSLEEPGTWEDVTTYTTNATITFDDGLDNQICYYRIGVKTGDYTSGAVELELRYSLGNIDGIARITNFVSSTSVFADVIVDMGDTVATDIWAEGEWSDFRGYPTSVCLYEGRCWWAGRNGIWASVSDAYESYDEFVEGDSGTISRTVGSGPVDVINWILPLQRLMAGAEGAEFSIRASSFDEVLTPSNFNIKMASNQGSAAVEAVPVDSRGVFVQRGGTRVMELAFDANTYDYSAVDLTMLCPEIGRPRIVRMASQRQPDTRIHCIRSDGTVAMAVFEKTENVLAWCEVETEGQIEDVVVLPGLLGSEEDQVYYVVRRTINSATVRYLEKWARESECIGGTVNKQADSFVYATGTSFTSVSGLSHLEGETVVVWGDGEDLGDFTVTSGTVTGFNKPVANAIVGLPYRAQWKSSKLAYAASMGSSLGMRKKIAHLGLIAINMNQQALLYGTDFATMYAMPDIEYGTRVTGTDIYDTYDADAFEFPGEWNSDSRVCLQAEAPRPATVLALVIPVETHEKY